MTLLDKLKSLLGLETSQSAPNRERDVGVTVEREPEEAPGPATETEPAVEGVEEPAAEAEEPEPEAEESEPEAEEPEAAGESPDVIKGIGPSYADRLADAGVETVSELADADADDLAEQTDLSETRLERWIERARNR